MLFKTLQTPVPTLSLSVSALIAQVVTYHLQSTAYINLHVDPFHVCELHYNRTHPLHTAKRMTNKAARSC